MKKKRKVLSVFLCTLMIAFCAVFGLNLSRDVGVNAETTEITDLTGTTWYFNEVLDYSQYSDLEQKGFHVDFVCPDYPGYSFYIFAFYFSNSSLLNFYRPGDVGFQTLQVYLRDNWVIDECRTIEILGGRDVESLELIEFLKLNAVLLDAGGSSSSSSPSVPQDSSSSSSSSSAPPAGPSSPSEVDPNILRYGIFNNALVMVYSYTSQTDAIVTRYPKYDAYYSGISFLTTYDSLYTTLSQQGYDINKFLKIGFRITFELPVSIDALMSIGTIGLGDSVLENAVWYGLASGYKMPSTAPENVTSLEWRSYQDEVDATKWVMRTAPNSPVYSNYVGLYFELSSLDLLKNLSLYMPYNGGYAEGYNKGMLDGYDQGIDDGYEYGSQDGYDDGYKYGHRIGYDDGYAKGMSAGNSFIGLMTAVVQAPVTVFIGLTDFEILGYNMSSLALGLLTAALCVCVLRLFTGGKAE